SHAPDFVGFSVPFPGNVFAAFFMAQAMKQLAPGIRTAMGGGYVNTELRALKEPRVFDYFDYVTLDDGERPLLNAIEHAMQKRPDDGLFRTFVRRQGAVAFIQGNDHDVPIAAQPAPDYEG